MVSELEPITIPSCPLCQKEHRYWLKIDRTVALGATDVSQMDDSEFTRIFICPNTENEYQSAFTVREASDSPILNLTIAGFAETGGQARTAEVSLISPHSRALYEAGKDLVGKSVEITGDFCKSMIRMCAGAIPIYLALLKFVVPEGYSSGVLRGVFLLAPAFVFLIAATVFTIGYLPQKTTFSLDIIEEIERARTAILNRRYKAIIAGFALFAASVCLAFIVLSINFK